MNAYISHLLKDIEAAKINSKALLSTELPRDTWIEDDGFPPLGFTMELSLGEILDLSLDQFPPASQLDLYQQELILNSLQSLYKGINVHLQIPEDELNTVELYTFYILALERYPEVELNGALFIDYCNNNPSDCVFSPENCTCNMWQEMEDSDKEDKWILKELQLLRKQIKSRYVSYLLKDMEEIFKPYEEEAPIYILLNYEDEVSDLIFGHMTKTIAEWINIDIDAFPPADKVSDVEALALANSLFQCWSYDDLLYYNVLSDSDAKVRYQTALDFFKLDVYFNGIDEFYSQEANAWPVNIDDANFN